MVQQSNGDYSRVIVDPVARSLGQIAAVTNRHALSMRPFQGGNLIKTTPVEATKTSGYSTNFNPKLTGYPNGTQICKRWCYPRSQTTSSCTNSRAAQSCRCGAVRRADRDGCRLGSSPVPFGVKLAAFLAEPAPPVRLAAFALPRRRIRRMGHHG